MKKKLLCLAALCIVAMVINAFPVYGETPGNSKLMVKDASSNTQFQVTDTGQLTLGNFASTQYVSEFRRTGANVALVLNRTDGAINYINATQSFGNFGTVNNFPLRLVTNAVVRMVLNTDNSINFTAGGAYIDTAGNFHTPSSRELKENIKELSATDADATLMKLNPVVYNYKVDKDQHHVGFIAEDVPDLVATKDRRTLTPMDIVAVLTKVVQDKSQVIDQQQKTIDIMASKLEKLEGEINRLKTKDYTAQK